MNNRNRFDKFDEHARQSLGFAQVAAQRFSHTYIGTEHMLLGLLDVTDGKAVLILESMGIEPQKVRNATEFIMGRGDRIVLGEIGLTPRAKKVIELAVDEARQINQGYIGTEHLLLALIREGEGIAAGVLESLGVTLAKAHHHTYLVLAARKSSHQAANAETNQPETVPGDYSYGLLTSGRAEGTLTPTPSSDARSKIPFDKFTERARRVLSLAQEESQRFQHNYIGTEHLLLGLVRERDSIAAHALKNLGVELDKVRDTVEFIIGRGDHIILGEIGLTPRAKHILELAVEEARQLNHPYIGPEHLLLGLVREGEGIAVGALESLGVPLVYVRAETLKIINREGTPGKQGLPKLPSSEPPDEQES